MLNNCICEDYLPMQNIFLSVNLCYHWLKRWCCDNWLHIFQKWFLCRHQFFGLFSLLFCNIWTVEVTRALIFNFTLVKRLKNGMQMFSHFTSGYKVSLKATAVLGKQSFYTISSQNTCTTCSTEKTDWILQINYCHFYSYSHIDMELFGVVLMNEV